MVTTLRWTIEELEGLPQPLEDKRYEIIDGELYVSTQPSWQHQSVCTRATLLLGNWSDQTGSGLALGAPGLVYARDEAVAPDVVWIRRERLADVLGEDGRLRASPDLVVEVLSPGPENEERDRSIKLALYARRGVLEHWIVNWRVRAVDVYRRGAGPTLQHVATLYEQDTLESPVLPGFSCRVAQFFSALP